MKGLFYAKLACCLIYLRTAALHSGGDKGQAVTAAEEGKVHAIAFIEAVITAERIIPVKGRDAEGQVIV